MSSAFLSVRLQFGMRLVDAERPRLLVAELLTSGRLGPLGSMATRKRDKFGRHVTANAEGAAEILASEQWHGLAFDNGRRAPEAFAEIENGSGGIGPDETKFRLTLAVPIGDDAAGQVNAIVEAAGLLDVASGFVAVEATFKDAQTTALGGFQIPERPGLGAQRRHERKARELRMLRLHREVAGPEWGTFLGAGHLEQVSAAQLRRSDAFVRVLEISPHLVFLQLTADPRDDLSGELEERLPAARAALAPVLMDLTA